MKNTFMLFVLALFLFQSCDNPVEEVDFACADNPLVCDVVEGNNAFGFDMLQSLHNEEPTSNQFISPMINTMGHKEMTLDDMNDGYKSMINTWPALDAEVDFNVANSIWNKEGFAVKQPFLDTNEEHYGSEVTTLPFDDVAKDKINTWVDDQTNGLIPTILNEIDPQAVMYLINAIYFKGDWKYAFDADATEAATFVVDDNTEVDVDMMAMAETDLQYLATDEFSAVQLPYNNESFEMTIILPNFGTPMAGIVEDLNNENWNQWRKDFATQATLVRMPKFEMAYKKELSRDLKEMGMSSAFANADFSGISDNANLQISEVIHKTFITVDEAGTEAAAVTSVGIINTSIDPNAPVYFTVNRPFIFMINEAETGHVVFLGKVLNPNE